MLAGCAADTSTEDTATSTDQALSSADDSSENDDDADANPDADIVLPHRAAYKLTLTSFDGVTLTGVTRSGVTVTVSTSAATKYRTANLNNYHPTDPCRTLAGIYDGTLGGQIIDQSTSGSIGSLATNSCSARVHVLRQTATIRAFRPVP